jgi:hypothetical protein
VDEHAVPRQRGGLTVNAGVVSEADEYADAQHMTVFLTEVASEDDAAGIASAAVSKDWFEALGIADERTACVTVARSFVEGTPAFEGPGALERFRDSFTRALARGV